MFKQANRIATGGWLCLATLSVLLFSGCATVPLQYSELTPPEADGASRIELTNTPFFPQTAYHCGPSALATLLQSSGVKSANPDTLADQIYLPGQRGSLQTELLGATRRANRVPYPLEPSLQDLIDELRAGYPVLVLQNLQLPRWPKWHYAVVIGFDLESEEVILRSGNERRQIVSLRRFEQTWQMGDYWALVIPPTGEIPVSASATRYLETVVPLEQQQRWEAASTAYRAAAQRWPENPASYMGLGNIAYQSAQYEQAARHYREAVEVAPEAPAGYYNLAWAMLSLGDSGAAREAAKQAQTLGPDHPRYSQAIATIETELSGQ